MTSETTYKILLVEDEESIANVVIKRLQKSGFVVDWAPDGETGLEKQRANDYSLILLDIHLPGISGFEVLESIRNQGHKTPVFIVSADRLIDDRIKGLRLGADDYLVKPFDFGELMARIEAILRRSSVSPNPTLRVGDLTIDMTNRRVLRGAHHLELSNIEFRLLELLAKKKNTPVSRIEIAREIWGHENYKESNVIDVYMGYLRKAVDEGGGKHLIEEVDEENFVLRA